MTLLFGNYSFPNKTFEVEEAPLDVNLKEELVIRRHGSTVQFPYLRARKFKIKGFVHNSDVDSTRNELSAMQQNLYANENAFSFLSGRYIDCYTKSFKSKYIRGTDGRVAEIEIQMVAQKPFFYAGTTATQVEALTDGCTFELVTEGNALSEPVFEFLADGGAITDGISVTNITNNNMHFRWRGEVANGNTLRIDVESFEILNNGTNGITYFSGYFITALAKTNLFHFDGESCQLTISRKDRWY